MKSRYHLEITRKALEPYFAPDALDTLLNANIGQDKIKYQFGHPHFHFDSNTFNEGFTYIEAQEKQIIECIVQGDYINARKALGRITHTWQDFYSHSNYIKLWLIDHPQATPEEIDPADSAYIGHPDLRSGKVYGLMEFLALLPILTDLITPLMPEDSHAKMNLDSPASGPLFAFNYQASLKRTRMIYERLIKLFAENAISQKQIQQFLGKFQEEEKV